MAGKMEIIREDRQKLNELEATIEALKMQSGFQFKPDEFDPQRLRISPELKSPPKELHTNWDNTATTTAQRRPTPECRRTTTVVDSDDNSGPIVSDATDSSLQTIVNDKESNKKKNWMLNSLGKAFSKRKTRTSSISEMELETAAAATDVSAIRLLKQLSIESAGSSASNPNNPGSFKRSFTLPSNLNPNPNPNGQTNSYEMTPSEEGSECSLSASFLSERDDLVFDLQRQLDEKDDRMREIQQEAVSSSNQLQQLHSVVMEMMAELSLLKAENDRLHRLVKQDGGHPSSSSSLLSSSSSLSRATGNDGASGSRDINRRPELDKGKQCHVDAINKRTTQVEIKPPTLLHKTSNIGPLKMPEF